MSILTLFCPICGQEHHVSSIAFKSFACKTCNNTVNQYCTTPKPSKPDQQTKPQSSVPTSTAAKFGIYSLVGAGALLLIIAAIAVIAWVGQKVNNLTTPTPQTVNTPVTATPPVEPPHTQSPTTTADSSSQPAYQLCDVRIENTLQGTDKTGGYKAVMNVQSKTLRLYYVGNEKEIIEVHYDGGGLNTMKLYRDSVLEAEKTMFRRSDLEPNDKTIIYTSRTEQIKITITYN